MARVLASQHLDMLQVDVRNIIFRCGADKMSLEIVDDCNSHKNGSECREHSGVPYCTVKI